MEKKKVCFSCFSFSVKMRVFSADWVGWMSSTLVTNQDR